MSLINCHPFKAPGIPWDLVGNITEHILTQYDGTAYDLFGRSAVISGDGTTVAVGAGGTDGTYAWEGAVYVYTKVGGTWTLQQKIVSTEPEVGSSYGSFGLDAVAISDDGNTLAIGNARKDVTGTDEGKVYVWTRSGGTWTEQQKIVSNVPVNYDYFGRSLALSGDGNTLLVGAPYDDPNNRDGAGSGEVWVRSGGTWTYQALLTAPNQEISAGVGWNVSLSYDGNVAAVTSLYTDYYQAASSVITGGGDGQITWSSQFVGFKDNVSQNNVEVHHIESGTNTPLSISTLDQGNGFYTITVHLETDGGGTAISTANEVIAAVAGDGTASTWISGVAGGTGNGTASAGFFSLSGGGVTLFDLGAAFVFNRTGSSWSHTQTLLPDLVSSGYQWFGWPVEISNDGTYLITAASGDDGYGSETGAVYIWHESGGTWSVQQKIYASDAGPNTWYGELQVGFNNAANLCVVGAAYKTVSGYYASGALYVYARSGTTWTEKQIITPSETEAAAYTGYTPGGGSMTNSGLTIVTGAPGNDVGANANQGVAYVYEYTL